MSRKKSTTPEDANIVSELKRTLKELSDIKFALDEAAIVAITDQTGCITYVNEKFCEISKYSSQELIGQDHRIINSGFHSKDFIRNLWTTIAQGKVWHGELRNRAKDNSIYWVDTTIIPFLNESGKPYQYIAIRYDITERKEAESRILQQASLLDKAQDAILVCDLNFRILYWNQGAERIYGWQAKDVLGKDICEVICPDDIEQIDAARKAFEFVDKWKETVNQTAKSSRRLYIETRWTLVRDDKELPDYYLVINTDITEQRKIQEQLLRAQRLDSIGTLAGGIAHDLNNILSPILMSADMLQLSGLDEETRNWISLIKENAQRGANLVKQVLTFARGVEGERAAIRLRHIIGELVKVLSQTLPKSISVEFRVAPDIDLIIGDPTQIQQVLMNLCINARDAMMTGGGKLLITAKNADLDENYARMLPEAKAGRYVMIEVSDQGEGMPPEIVSRIFDPFFTTKEVGKGTGLGLSTAVTIIKSHHGFITVDSAPNVGSVFTIYLPGSEQFRDDIDTKNSLSTPHGSGELILVVDDEADIRQITKAALQKFGYKVLTANDGKEATVVFARKSEEIALVLTDMAMPFMDGAATIRALRKISPKLKVIAASGLDSPGQKTNIEALAVNAFLTKPFTADELLRTVAKVLNGKL